ncbi:MAG: phytoene desaturase family protein [bacterium]
MKHSEKSEKKKIVIIGAGVEGLAAAIILLHQGFEVEIFEQSSAIGGKNAELTLGDFHFDTNPAPFVMTPVIDTIFKAAGKKSTDYLTMIALEPMYRLIFHDLILNATINRENMYSQIANYAPGNEEGFEIFLDAEQKRFDKLIPLFKKDHSSFLSLLNGSLLKSLPTIVSKKSLFDHLGNYFNDETLRIAFSFQSQYIGMSPWECPSLFSILSFMEHKYGIYHVEGGTSAIPKAMARIIEEQGGTIHLNTAVKRLILKGRKAYGVLLTNKKRIYADDVIINADFAYAMTHLIPYGALKKNTPTKIKKYQYSSSAFMLYLGLDTIFNDLPHHTFIFAEDYKKNITDIFKRKKLSHDFSFYIQNAAVTDETLAPNKKSGLHILVQVPNNESKIDWMLEKRDFRNKILHEVSIRTPLKNLEKHIEIERIITPKDWEEKENLYNGSIFNLAHPFSQLFYFRPHNQFEELGNCYLVGGGTHPGGGLSTSCESGHIVAQLLSRKYHNN